MLKLKWFSIFRLCCLILFSLFDFPCLLPLEQCIVVCNIFHGVQVYLCEVEDHSVTTSNTLDFWIQREHVYDKLLLVAEDILAAPASQAYVERVFSVCGLLTVGRRNIMSKSLQMQACLKLNCRVLASTDFNTTAWKYKTCSCVIMQCCSKRRPMYGHVLLWIVISLITN